MAVSRVPLRQLALNEVYTFTYSGLLSPETMMLRLYNDTGADRVINSVRIAVGMNPIDAPVSVDVLKNGFSIFDVSTGMYAPPVIPAGQFTGTSLAAPVRNQWLEDEYLTVSILSIGTTFPGEDLTVNVVVSE